MHVIETRTRRETALVNAAKLQVVSDGFSRYPE
jgi:hypothetical protein